MTFGHHVRKWMDGLHIWTIVLSGFGCCAVGRIFVLTYFTFVVLRCITVTSK